MKRFLAVAALSSALSLLAACGNSGEPGASAETPAPAEAAAAPATPHTPAAAAEPAPTPAATGAPAFAVLYPGGAIEGEPTLAAGPAGPGGLVTYVTDADPDTVIAFHRAHAEAEGLSSVTAMNQGDARAYGAAKGEQSVQVVASPTDDGRTSVQLSWSAGR